MIAKLPSVVPRESLKFGTMHLYLQVNHFHMKKSKLGEAAAIAMREVLALREGEEVLIATNVTDQSFRVARAYFEAAKAAGGKPTIVVSPVKDRLELADRLLLEALRAGPDVFIGGLGENGRSGPLRDDHRLHRKGR